MLRDPVVNDVPAIPVKRASESLMAHGQLEVIKTEEFEDRRMEIIHVDRFFGDRPTDLVRSAVGESPFHAAASHPEGESEGMMISSGDGREAEPVFAKRRPSEFTGKDDQCFIQETSLFEILQQSRYG